MKNKEHIYNIKAIRKDFDLDVVVRKMDKDEMSDDGVIYYCEETGQIYTEDELTFTDQPLERIPEETKEIRRQLYTQQELDRAREEGFIKGVKECTEKLSKLTTK